MLHLQSCPCEALHFKVTAPIVTTRDSKQLVMQREEAALQIASEHREESERLKAAMLKSGFGNERWVGMNGQLQ